MNQNQSSTFSDVQAVESPKLVCINSIDSTGLEQLPVFGSVLSSRTIKFRNALGSFYSVNQISEVYGLDSLDYKKVKSLFVIDTTKLEKLCINSVEEK